MEMKLKLSLHQANKFRAQLKTKISNTTTILVAQENIVKTKSKDVLLNSLKNRYQKEKQKHNFLLSALETEKQLTQKLFNANCQSGLSDLLEESKYIKKKIAYFDNLNQHDEYSKQIDQKEFEKIYDLVQNSEDEYCSMAYLVNVEANKEDISSLKKQLRQIEDEINQINVTNFIELDISQIISQEFGF